MSVPQPLTARFGPFGLDESNARLTRDAHPLALTPKAFAVLCALVRQPGQLVTKDGLLDAVWGHRHVSESVLKTTISELRAALGDDARQPRYIETASRRGYRFIGLQLPPPVAPAAPSSALGLGAQEHDTRSRMIGRQAALAKLRELWAKALTGQRQIVWIVGEAGVGKTTLIKEFLSGIDPGLWSHGQCVEQYGAGEPYLPVLEALGVLCQRDPGLPAMLRAHAPTWLMQMPKHCSKADRAALRLELAGATTERMVRELREATDPYSFTRPLLFVTEDIHWSDRATLGMLDYLARSREPACGMWLSSFRLTEVMGDDHPLRVLRHELRLHKRVTEISLDSFSEQEVGDYLTSRFPSRPMSEPFVRRLHQHTDGLPLFLVNVVEDLVVQGTLDADRAPPEAAAVGDLQVPENLAGVIEKQLGRLQPEQRRMLEAASVCGMEFRARVVAEALGLDADAVTAQCEQLAGRQQWLQALDVSRLADGVLDARYGFRHALYKRVLYQGIGAMSRAQLHHKIAVSMERGRETGARVTSAELATHYELSHDPMSALRHYADAAGNAQRHFAPAETMALIDRALGLLSQCPASAERTQVELKLSIVRAVISSQREGMSSAEAGAAYERARRVADGVPESASQGWVLAGLGQVQYGRADFAAALTVGHRIHELVGRQQQPALEIASCTLIGMVHATYGDHASARLWLQRGIDVCAELGERVPTAQFFMDPNVMMGGHLALELLALGLVDQARDRAARTLEWGRSRQHPLAEGLATRCAGLVSLGLDDPLQTAAHAKALRAVADAHKLPPALGNSLMLSGWAEARLGEPRSGLEKILEAQRVFDGMGMLAGSTRLFVLAAEIALLAGSLDAARRHLEAASGFTERTGEKFQVPDLLIVRGRVALAEGEVDAAHNSFDAACVQAHAQGALWTELEARIASCERPRESGDQERAVLAQVLSRIGEGLDTPRMLRARRLLG